MDIKTDCQLEIDGCRRASKSSLLLRGAMIWRPFIANCKSVRTRRKESKGLFSTWKDWFQFKRKCSKNEM